MVVANLVNQDGTGFESDQNEVVLVLRTGENIPLARAPKREIADRIFDQVMKLRLALHAANDEGRSPAVSGFYQDLGVKSVYRRQAPRLERALRSGPRQPRITRRLRSYRAA